MFFFCQVKPFKDFVVTSELEPHSNCHQPHLYGAKVPNYRPFALALHSGEPYTLFCKSCTEPHGGGLNSFAIVISRKGATTAAAAGYYTTVRTAHFSSQVCCSSLAKIIVYLRSSRSAERRRWTPQLPPPPPPFESSVYTRVFVYTCLRVRT